MLYWFDAQEQTSRSRQKKFDDLYFRFSPECNVFGLTFHEGQEIAKNWLKLKQFMKPNICESCRLRVKREVKDLRAVTKESSLDGF